MIYYNENEPEAVYWLNRLIETGHLPPGVVDDRSIEDVRPSDLAGFRQCHFFAGIGGWAVALHRAGYEEKIPKGFQVWTGSCPCQPFSAAGKRLGKEDKRHLWPVFHSLIAECRPLLVLGEQVSQKGGHTWLADVFHDLEGSGYYYACVDSPACGYGADQERQRLYWSGFAGEFYEPGDVDEQSIQELLTPLVKPTGFIYVPDGLLAGSPSSGCGGSGLPILEGGQEQTGAGPGGSSPNSGVGVPGCGGSTDSGEHGHVDAPPVSDSGARNQRERDGGTPGHSSEAIGLGIPAGVGRTQWGTGPDGLTDGIRPRLPFVRWVGREQVPLHWIYTRPLRPEDTPSLRPIEPTLKWLPDGVSAFMVRGGGGGSTEYGKEAEEVGLGEDLRTMRNTSSAEEVQRETGGSSGIPEEEVLRKSLHGGEHVERILQLFKPFEEQGEEIGTGNLLSVRGSGAFGGSPQRPQPKAQYPGEFADFVSKLPRAHAFAKLFGDHWTEEILRVLLAPFREVRDVSYTLHEMEEAWGSIIEKDQDRIVMEFNRRQWVDYPILPLEDRSPSRVARLRGYGNAVYLPQAEAFAEVTLEEWLEGRV